MVSTFAFDCYFIFAVFLLRNILILYFLPIINIKEDEF